MLLKIGELAKRAGLTVRTLHHYDHVGLLSPSERSASGFRLYNQADVIRLHKILALRQFGCSLSDIGAFLAKPGSSILEIIEQQMSVLDKQIQRAQTLQDRLSRLREQISRGKNTGLTDWLNILEKMTMYERHFSKEELHTLRSNKAAGNLDDEWGRLVSSVLDLMDRGISPESEEAQDLAWHWMQLLKNTTGNDPSLAVKLKRAHQEEHEAQLFNRITPEMIEFLTHSFANARLAIFAKYLSSCELQIVRSRQAAHLSDWPPLITKARQQIERGAAPDDPAVQDLAHSWQWLLRESYWGEDFELEDKIRSVFEKEPDLFVSVGMDASMIAFMQQAIGHLQQVQVEQEIRHDAVPKPSALMVAKMRAAHQLLDAPLVFEDPLALRILGATEEESLRSDLFRHSVPLLTGLRTSVVVRSRVAEDEWVESKQRGIRQYVILGAGLDTFAYRKKDRDSSRIFEVDLPATQHWKHDCLRAAGISEPASLTFVPIDFESSTLADGLTKAGFYLDEPAFFSWLGVVVYLEENAIKETLRFIASLAPGSGVVFDYQVIPSLLSPKERTALEFLAARAAERGELWKTYFEPSYLEDLLRSLGFSQVRDLGPKQLNALYLSGRKDGLRKSGVSRLVCATL